MFSKWFKIGLNIVIWEIITLKSYVGPFMDYFLRFKIFYFNFFESEKNIKLLVLNHYLRIFLALCGKKFLIFSLIGPLCGFKLACCKKGNITIVIQ